MKEKLKGKLLNSPGQGPNKKARKKEGLHDSGDEGELEFPCAIIKLSRSIEYCKQSMKGED